MGLIPWKRDFFFFTACFVRKALEPPDEDHPYGHVKFEALSAIITFSYLLSMMIILLHALFERLTSGYVASIGVRAPLTKQFPCFQTF